MSRRKTIEDKNAETQPRLSDLLGFLDRLATVFCKLSFFSEGKTSLMFVFGQEKAMSSVTAERISLKVSFHRLQPQTDREEDSISFERRRAGGRLQKYKKINKQAVHLRQRGRGSTKNGVRRGRSRGEGGSRAWPPLTKTNIKKKKHESSRKKSTLNSGGVFQVGGSTNSESNP